MSDEQTNKGDTTGDEDNQPLTLYQKTEAIVARQEEANKKTEELLARQEELFANQRLAGTAGGHVEAEKVDPAKSEADKIASAFK